MNRTKKGAPSGAPFILATVSRCYFFSLAQHADFPPRVPYGAAAEKNARLPVSQLAASALQVEPLARSARSMVCSSQRLQCLAVKNAAFPCSQQLTYAQWFATNALQQTAFPTPASQTGAAPSFFGAAEAALARARETTAAERAKKRDIDSSPSSLFYAPEHSLSAPN